MWCVLILRSGRFAGAVFDGHTVLTHKVRAISLTVREEHIVEALPLQYSISQQQRTCSKSAVIHIVH